MLQAKRLRQERENKRRMLREMLPKIIVSVQQDVDANLICEWRESSKNFVSFLKIIAEWLGKNEDVERIWLRGMCCMITDVAEIEKTPEPLQTPKAIFLWFARYVDNNLAKNEIAWESKIFSQESIQASYEYLENLSKRLHG